MKTLISAPYFKWLNDFKTWEHISLKTEFKQKLFKSNFLNKTLALLLLVKIALLFIVIPKSIYIKE